jgi:hypothetical protein
MSPSERGRYRGKTLPMSFHPCVPEVPDAIKEKFLEALLGVALLGSEGCAGSN